VKNTKKKNIGFWIAPDCQSKGYTTEATKALLEFGFRQYGAESITADHLDWNIASKRVLEKSGFKWKQSFPKDYLKNNKWETSEYYVINKKQFQNIQS